MKRVVIAVAKGVYVVLIVAEALSFAALTLLFALLALGGLVAISVALWP
jgi:hypothetical protein